MSQALVDLLVKEKVLSEAHIAHLRAGLTGTPEHVMPRCVAMGLIDDQKLLPFLAQKFHCKIVSLESSLVSTEASSLFNPAMIEQLQAVPLNVTDTTVRVAVADPTFIPAVTERIKTEYNKNTEVVMTSFKTFGAYLKKIGVTNDLTPHAISIDPQVQQNSRAQKSHLSAAKAKTPRRALDSNIPESGEATTILNAIFTEAVRLGASDIHIEPTRTSVRVRVRIDGTMQDLKELSPILKETLVARIKILAKMNSTERRTPQDGKIKTQYGNREFDFRVNVLPMIYGESIVLRIIKQDSLNLTFSHLGFSAVQEKIVRKGINAPYGMVLVTGPTGSGKTTTLYAALTELNEPSMKLATVEDPVEYNIEGVVQTQISKESGLGFAEVLRALLRQDPDVILVGEIRDQETAEVAIQAGITGHVVLSTLHTNDACSTILRLTNMGIEPILVVTAVNVVISQRLLRKLCKRCRYSGPIAREQVSAFGLDSEKYGRSSFYHAKGCSDCAQTGYKGRVAVYEVLDFTDDLKELVLRGENLISLRRAAVANGMETLPASALNCAIAGFTSLQEALSCVL